ncbi:hypothetical protein C2E23DRAFT_818007 [Lenzites betulinus]|nr:hypothetical protein C2E23DRAFT_818007 [Lenzites betulinus]
MLLRPAYREPVRVAVESPASWRAVRAGAMLASARSSNPFLRRAGPGRAAPYYALHYAITTVGTLYVVHVRCVLSPGAFSFSFCQFSYFDRTYYGEGVDGCGLASATRARAPHMGHNVAGRHHQGLRNQFPTTTYYLMSNLRIWYARSGGEQDTENDPALPEATASVNRWSSVGVAFVLPHPSQVTNTLPGVLCASAESDSRTQEPRAFSAAIGFSPSMGDAH